MTELRSSYTHSHPHILIYISTTINGLWFLVFMYIQCSVCL